MKQPLQLYTCIAAFLLLLTSCDHGLDPGFTSGFDGTVTIVDGWSEDSEILQVYVVVFKRIPEDIDDAFEQFSEGTIRFTQLTPPFQDEYTYSINIDPGIYELVVCIGVEGTQFLNVDDWVLSGIYTETNNPFEYASINIPENERLANVDITASVIHTLPIEFFFNF